MKKNSIKLRLYRQHDMDLLLLYKNKEFGFAKAVKRALHAYAAKEPYFFIPPPTTDIHLYEFKSSYNTKIFLDDEKDADIIEFLDGIKKLYRNATVKNILRGAMVGPYVYGCMMHDDDRLQTEKNIYEPLRNNKKIDTLNDAPTRKKTSTNTQKEKRNNKSNNKNNTNTKIKMMQTQSKSDIEKDTNIQINDSDNAKEDNSFNFFNSLNSMYND